MATKKCPTSYKKKHDKGVKIAKTLKGRLNFNQIIEGSIPIVSIDTIGHGTLKVSINPSVKNFRSLSDSSDHQ